MAEAKFISDTEQLSKLAPVAQAPLQQHVFVCNGKSCAAVGSADVKAAFSEALRARNLLYGKEKKGKNPQGSVVLSDCSSVGLCAVGAAVLVYPAGVWYAQVRAADVPEIVEEHIVQGRVVARLALVEVPSHEATKS